MVGDNKSITDARDYLGHVIRRRGITLPDCTNICLITHSQAILELAKAMHRHEVYDIGSCRPTELYYFYPDNMMPYALLSQHLGAPMAAVALEELIAISFEQFISIGAAGHTAMNGEASMGIGDLLLPDRALVHEGTSSHYSPNITESQPDTTSFNDLQEALDNLNVNYRKGTVATTDAIYRETDDFIRNILSRGAMGIDMEASAQFTVCSYHGKRIAALFYISDIVNTEYDWKIGFDDDRLRTAQYEIFHAFLEYLRRLK